jgi:hypothetical protein
LIQRFLSFLSLLSLASLIDWVGSAAIGAGAPVKSVDQDARDLRGETSPSLASPRI